MTWIRRAISPVIATVIIVAVAIAIAVAVIGWLTGLWSSLAGGTPAISIPSAYVIIENNTNSPSQSKLIVTMYIKNDGAGSDKIIKLEVDFKGTSVDCKNINGTPVSGNSIPGAVIKASSAGWANVTCTIDMASDPWKSVNIGDKMIVRIHLEKSGIVPLTVSVKQVVKSSS